MNHAKKPLTSRRISTPICGAAVVPGDKSLSHRALIFGALAAGETVIKGLLESDDVLKTAAALGALGVQMQRSCGQNGATWTIKGCGGKLSEPKTVLDMGNSGTAARLLTGLVAGQNFSSFLSGDQSLNGRPMRRVIKPLSDMGVSFAARQDQFLPMMVAGKAALNPINYESPVASAQVKSAILLAGLNANGVTTVYEPHLSRDHTERMAKAFGWVIETEECGGGAVRVSTKGGQTLTAPKEDIVIPSDPSSAAFLIAAAILVEGSDLIIRNVNINPTRIGFVTTLMDMGADLTYENKREQGGEPVADIRARYSPSLKGIDVPLGRVPSMIDEFPIFSVVASCADGVTTMTGLAELRVKESDRLSAMAQGLTFCGVDLTEAEDGLTIRGYGRPPKGADVQAAKDLAETAIPTYFDHRIAMSFLILGAVSENPVTVDDTSAIATSFPIFIELMASLGLDFEIIA